MLKVYSTDFSRAKITLFTGSAVEKYLSWEVVAEMSALICLILNLYGKKREGKMSKQETLKFIYRCTVVSHFDKCFLFVLYSILIHFLMKKLYFFVNSGQAFNRRILGDRWRRKTKSWRTSWGPRRKPWKDSSSSMRTTTCRGSCPSLRDITGN